MLTYSLENPSSTYKKIIDLATYYDKDILY